MLHKNETDTQPVTHTNETEWNSRPVSQSGIFVDASRAAAMSWSAFEKGALPGVGMRSPFS